MYAADIGGGRELALSQAVSAIVLDDVGAIHVAADEVHELAETNRSGVAVARDAEHDEIAVGERGPGGQRGHAAVHSIEAMGALDEVGGGLGRAADARHLGQEGGSDTQFIESFLEMIGDGVVAAASAERGGGTLIGVARETDAVEG